MLTKVLRCRRDGKALERFLEDYFAGHVKRYIKSEQPPETNSGAVKVCPIDLNNIFDPQGKVSISL